MTPQAPRSPAHERRQGERVRIPRLLDYYLLILWWRLGVERLWLRLARRWCMLFGHRWEQLVTLDGTPVDTWMCARCELPWWQGVDWDRRRGRQEGPPLWGLVR